MAFPSTSGRDARGHRTPRPQRDRGVPGAPGESRLLGILCARSQSGPDGGASASRALRKGVDRDVLGLTRHAASPTANKRQACRPAPYVARGTPQSKHTHTHSRSHSGTPHAQYSDACTVFHVSACACGAGKRARVTDVGLMHRTSSAIPASSACAREIALASKNDSCLRHKQHVIENSGVVTLVFIEAGI